MLRRSILGASALAAVPRVAFAANPDVAIVGAGVAGIAAARALKAAGKSVIVIEARDRIGGRAFTDTSLGFAFDHGAQWIEAGTTNPAMAILREMGAKPQSDRERQMIYIGGKELSKDDYARLEKITGEASRKLAEILKKLPDVPVGRILVPQDRLEQLAYAMVGPLEAGVETAELSALDFTRQPDAEPQFAVPGGLGAMIARWGAKVPVKLGTKVVRIDSTGAEVAIETIAGQVRAKAAVVTVPTGVLAAGAIGFAPQLSAAKKEAISGLPMSVYNKVALTFTRRVIDAPAGANATALTKADLAFDSVLRPQGQEAAICFSGGAHGRQLEEQGSSAAVAFALSALAEIYGNDLRGALAKSVVTRWGHDLFARGSWSTARPGHADKRTVLALPHHDRVFFAGEATDPVWAARIGGAYLSGLRAAKEALGVLSRN